MKHFLKILFIVLLFSSCSKKDEKVINANDFGLSEKTDATIAIRKALEACKNQSAHKLIIPKGRYEFYPDRATEQYCVTSNNDNSLKKIAFQLKDFRDFEIDGQGSVFIFHGNMLPFNVDGAKNVRIKNINIDWKKPFYLQGLVVATDKKNKTFDIEIDTSYSYHLEKDILFFGGDGWSQDIGYNQFFDSKTRASVYNAEKYELDTWNPLINTQYGAKELRKGLVRITDSIAVLPKVGWVWIIKGCKNPNRLSPALRIFGSKDIVLSHINIYHAGGMGVLGERSENIFLNTVKVMLPPNSKRIISTTADATHFVNCRGHIEIDSCFFENMLDDGSNVHGIYGKLTKIVNKHTIEINAVHFQQDLLAFAATGDTIKVYNNQTLEEYKTLIVKELRYVNEHYAELTFAEDISGLKLNSGVENYNWYPSFTIKNSTIKNNRARGILVSTRKKVIIENNRFLNLRMSAICIAGDMNFWFESGGVKDVTIRNNYFLDCCTSGEAICGSIVHIAPIFPHPEKTDHCYHNNILIENNTIETFDNSFIDALSVNGLIVKGNTIKQTNTFKPLLPGKSNIDIKYCKNVVIEHNKYKGKLAGKVEVDRASKSNVKISNNIDLY